MTRKRPVLFASFACAALSPTCKRLSEAISPHARECCHHGFLKTDVRLFVPIGRMVASVGEKDRQDLHRRDTFREAHMQGWQTSRSKTFGAIMLTCAIKYIRHLKERANVTPTTGAA